MVRGDLKTVGGEKLKKDAREVRKQRADALNELYNKLTSLYSLQASMAIYYLSKHGRVGAATLARAFGRSPTSIYSVIEKFEEEYSDEIDLKEGEENE